MSAAVAGPTKIRPTRSYTTLRDVTSRGGELLSKRCLAPSGNDARVSSVLSCEPRSHDSMTSVSVRYIVQDVDEAIAFYRDQLGFAVEMHPAPALAMLSRGSLRLLLSAPSGQSGGGQILAGGRRPEPGGWNRIQ